ncbi:TRAP transporter large permease [Rhizobiales bacterium]|uniref:TRAP transporter large permease n=1 Tax=Hongsoonwoonella zoysiae TaxID=2821844 RepID=UPI0015613E03|nr:TRAP transporter large permease [Hongsoonwoonella zoysiae]NRG17930.1 TRAP transporter large permease [Hongsoonwoonella zoysiae]
MGMGSVFVGFFSMMSLLLMSFPIAVIMVLLGVVGGVVLYGWPLLNSMGPVIWGVQNENILTAIPLFVLLGELLLRSGIADRMYGALSLWLGRLPGGLLHTNIGCCSLFAATSGSSVATAATVGTVALPALKSRGYGARQSLGSLAAGGTLGILIPPAIIFAVVMGSIYFGIATPTESAALGVVTALLFAWREGKLSLEFFDHCFRQTAKTTGMILLIITAAFMLNVTLALGGIAQTMTEWVASFGLSPAGLLMALIVFYLFLGMFMDVLSMQVLTIPVALPIVTAVGIDPIWFGIFIVLMCELGMITPPVGMNLYVVQGVRRDGGPFRDVVYGAIPYALIMILFTILLIEVPEIVLWLPESMSGR